MVWDVLHRSNDSANGIRLPEMSNKPYIQYGVGIQRTWSDKFSAYGQAMLRNGGKNGISLSFGFRWALGKDSKKELTKNQDVNIPSISNAATNKNAISNTKTLSLNNLGKTTFNLTNNSQNIAKQQTNNLSALNLYQTHIPSLNNTKANNITIYNSYNYDKQNDELSDTKHEINTVNIPTLNNNVTIHKFAPVPTIQKTEENKLQLRTKTQIDTLTNQENSDLNTKNYIKIQNDNEYNIQSKTILAPVPSINRANTDNLSNNNNIYKQTVQNSNITFNNNIASINTAIPSLDKLKTNNISDNNPIITRVQNSMNIKIQQPDTTKIPSLDNLPIQKQQNINNINSKTAINEQNKFSINETAQQSHLNNNFNKTPQNVFTQTQNTNNAILQTQKKTVIKMLDPQTKTAIHTVNSTAPKLVNMSFGNSKKIKQQTISTYKRNINDTNSTTNKFKASKPENVKIIAKEKSVQIASIKSDKQYYIPKKIVEYPDTK